MLLCLRISPLGLGSHRFVVRRSELCTTLKSLISFEVTAFTLAVTVAFTWRLVGDAAIIGFMNIFMMIP
jgi:hypothetical protein